MKALWRMTTKLPCEDGEWPYKTYLVQVWLVEETRVQVMLDLEGSKKESLGAYAANPCLYTRQGYPTFNDRQQEELTLKAFVQSLQPERLREHICLSAPGTLAVAPDEAEPEEHILHSPARSTLCTRLSSMREKRKRRQCVRQRQQLPSAQSREEPPSAGERPAPCSHCSHRPKHRK